MIEVVNKYDIRTKHACEQYKRRPIVSLIEWSPLLCGDPKFGKLNRRTAVRLSARGRGTHRHRAGAAIARRAEPTRGECVVFR